MPRDAALEDFQVRRDDDGELALRTETVTLPGGDAVDVEIVPLTTGHLRRYERDREGDFDRMDDAAIAVILEEHYRTPDFRDEDGHVATATVNDIPAARLEPLLSAFELMQAADESDLAAAADRDADAGN
jgi:hypothetical protein